MKAREAARLRRHRHASWLIVGLVTMLFAGTATIDHGLNWDEWALIEGARASVREVEVAQPRHFYNGFYLSCALAVVAWHGLDEVPYAISEVSQRPAHPFTPHNYPSISAWQTDMFRLLGSEEFKLQVRAVFVALSALSILLIFLIVLRLFPHRYLEAAAAAALMGLSWEIAVRARCTEVDAPQMMLVTLHIYAMTLALTATTRNRALLAMMGVGAVTGLVIGCKMTGVYLLVPSIGLAWALKTHSGWRDRSILSLAVIAMMVATVAALAPETYSDPVRVLHQGFDTAAGYRSVQPGYPFYVDPPFEHFYRVQLWTFLDAPSPFTAVSVLFSLIAFAGFVQLARRRPHFSALAALYPLAVLATMCALPLLQMRNFLQIFPYVCIAFGAGIIWIRIRWPNPKLGMTVAAVLGLGFLLNAGWLFHAQRSVRDTTRDSILEDVTAHMAASDHDFYTSRRLHGALQDAFDADFECEGPTPDEAELHDPRVLMYYTDHVPRQWLSVRMGFVERTFAPINQNYDWYVTWKGHLAHHRVVLMSVENAEEMHVAIPRMLRCRRRR